MRYLLAIALSALLYTTAAAHDNVSVGINIGFNMGGYPSLVRVPGYPVYYDPRVSANYFFYDGLYWVYADDNWYQSGWYNGPWIVVRPEYVPVYVLRVPVRYYRRPPAYFHGWRADAPPHWNEHWGNDWEQHRSGWNQWDRHAYVAPAPLPKYQRSYSGARYPVAPQQQQAIRSEKYRYQPREDLTKQHWQQQANGADSHPGSHPQQAQEDNGHGNPHKQGDHPDNHGNGQGHQ
jgi:hypothetical protein